MDPLFEIELDRAATGTRDAGQSIYRQLKAAILDGRLAAGTRLPPTRKSASFFGVSRNTAVEIYDRLFNEGYVVARHGAGTYVAEQAPAPAPLAPPPPGDLADRRLNPFWLRPDIVAAMGFWREQPARPAPSPDAPAIDFRPALIDARLFPFDVFRRVSARQLRGLEKRPARNKSPQGNQGSYALRAAITQHIALTRAVVCRAADVLVTSGAQQGFDLLARTLVTPHETIVAIEDPGYPPMRVAFAAAGAKLVPVSVDEEGLIVEQIPPEAGVICVCPSHQFPLGVTMSPHRRQALVALARRRGAVIVEDDYDGEFRYEGGALEALRGADAADVVFYVGTFSKCMLPALRLGFIVAPDWAMRTLVAAKNCLDWHCSIPVQRAVAGFIADGHLAHHVRRMRQIYQRRRARLLTVLGAEFGAWLEPLPAFYGMHVAAACRTAADLDPVTETLLRRNVKIHSLSRYYLGPPDRTGLVFGFGAVDLPEMEQGLSALLKALGDTRN